MRVDVDPRDGATGGVHLGRNIGWNRLVEERLSETVVEGRGRLRNDDDEKCLRTLASRSRGWWWRRPGRAIPEVCRARRRTAARNSSCALRTVGIQARVGLKGFAKVVIQVAVTRALSNLLERATRSAVSDGSLVRADIAVGTGTA